MLNRSLKNVLTSRVLPHVQTPAQYLGGERNMIRKEYSDVRGRLCMAFQDTYTIGMSHHGMQIFYSLMNGREDWVCERAFTPWHDMEQRLRAEGLPLYSLENFTPLACFDVLGFTLQYEISYTNILTMLDLGGIPLRSEDRGIEHPLVIAGGPCAQNPEPIAPFIDLFVTGDGEPSLTAICELWKELRGLNTGPRPEDVRPGNPPAASAASRQQREELLLEAARRLPYAYVPRFYEPEYGADGRVAALHPTHPDVPTTIEPSVISSLEDIPLPTKPIVPYIECVHDRIAVEIMRGCPWQCRFCQSTVIKRPLRVRKVETIVQSALDSYRNTGFNELSLLSLSSSDYPHFEELLIRMKEVFGPLGVNISLPSLRVNEALKIVAAYIGDERRHGLTLAPEVARDDMREQIRKKIKNQDMYDGCREAFANGIQKVKLYFMCGLPGEREVDLDGIIEMAETLSRIGKEVRGHNASVTASVSNFVPKAHTPYQWNGMQQREYFHWARHYLKQKVRMPSVRVKVHNVETSMLEGILSRGDRRVADAIQLAWQRGSRLDSWTEHLNPQLWWDALADCQIDVQRLVHEPYEIGSRLPWDHVNVKKGRPFLEKEQQRSVVQLAAMADAV